jgi:hypothetical protein
MSNTDVTSMEVEKLFNVMGITKVVYVDDDLVEADVADIIGAQNREQILTKYFPNIKIRDEEILITQLRNSWETLGQKIKQKIYLETKLVNDTDVSHEQKMFIDIFLNIIPDDMLYPMIPAKWVESKNDLLKENKNTLFLFDLDLQQEGGRHEDGIKLIVDILRSIEIITGIITKNATQDNCLSIRDRFVDENESLKDRFFVIPKENLANNLSLFLYLLKMTVLSQDFLIFKTIINDMLLKASEKAKEKINNISVDDFEHIVFKSPMREGLWEPEMFFKIYTHYQRREFYIVAHKEEKLIDSITKIRSVSDISTKPIGFLIPSKAWEYQRDELYENADYLNHNHLPIEIGDIFEETERELASRKFSS